MIRPHDFVVSLDDVDKDDVVYVGGKAANLGEMIQAKFPVPEGFVVTANAYRAFISDNSLGNKIDHLLSSINYQNQSSLSQVSQHIQRLILNSEIPEPIVASIFKFYEEMGGKTRVAIRSSAVGEDSKEASFAGQNDTFLDVVGESSVIEKVRRAWASLFSPRSIFYRHEKKINHTKTAIALVVQRMVASDQSGVIFTIDPISGDKSKVIVEAIFGLGEYIVQGKVTPDHYEVDKKDQKILSKNIQEQKVLLKKDGASDKEVKTPIFKRKSQKITDSQILALADLAIKIEKHYYFPQDIEWACEGRKLYIVQTRPITTIGNHKKQEVKPSSTKPILIGQPASPGIGTGHVRKIKNIKDIGKIKREDVLVAPLTNPEYVPAMKKASAIITELGGRTSHAAIVAREFGVPAVVGASHALSVLSENEIVTVNGKTGEIFRGGVVKTNYHHDDTSIDIKTATKVMVNIGQPEIAKDVASKNVDGVGLLRAEFIIAGIGIHPKKMIHDGKSKEFVDKLAEGVATIAKAFYPRPVLYRTTDFKTNEYRDLVGGKNYEPEESNPMLGYRGAFRYMHDPDVFKLELRAIKKVREKMGLNNLNLMVPFVRTVKELEEVKKLINGENLKRSATFKLYMMAEIPANVILIEDFIKVGIDGVSIGSNDLTMLMLGIDRDNHEVATEFDERNPAVMWAIERLVKACKKANVNISICGQAPSVYPSLVDELVSLGIDSISVSPDALNDTRRIVYLAEGRVVRKGK